MPDEPRKAPPGTYAGMGLVVGAGLGGTVGIFLDNLALGAAFGAGGGLVLGAAVDGMIRR